MASQPKTSATIVDIARKLKVSAMTVSRALTGSTEVSIKTREKVIRCAQELGYRPHRWARSLVTRKSAIVGVVIPEITHSYFAEITSGIEEVVEQHGYDLLLCHSRRDARRERAEIDMLVGSRVEGLIVASEQSEKESAVFESLQESGIPFVLIDRYFPGHPFSHVRVDDVAVGRLATNYLIELGHRRIAHIHGPSVSIATARYQGYLRALRKARIPLNKQWVVSADLATDGGREAMQRLLATEPRPTAIFAANDPIAIGAIYACREAGLAVPGDVSIIGAGNIEGVHHPNPFLTTIDWPREELGRVAARFLINTIKDPGSAGPQQETFVPKLLSRQSTAPMVG